MTLPLRAPLPRTLTLTGDRPGAAMAALGSAAVVAGGLVAAVTGPLALARGSWAAAYLVLVCGVGQLAMAAARLLAPAVADGPADAPAARARSARRGWQQLGTWNLANALVMAGTLAAPRVSPQVSFQVSPGVSPWIVDVGGLGCVAAVALAWLHARTLPRGFTRGAYRAVLALLALSIPVGLLLTHLRSAR